MRERVCLVLPIPSLACAVLLCADPSQSGHVSSVWDFGSMNVVPFALVITSLQALFLHDERGFLILTTSK